MFSYQEDQPHERRGSLIPPPHQDKTRSKAQLLLPSPSLTPAGSIMVAVALLIIGAAGIGQVTNNNVAALLPSFFSTSSEASSDEVEVAPTPSLSQAGVFESTRDAFIAEKKTFIEVDLSNYQLRFIKEGVSVFSAAVLAEGEPGSWWATPAGVYEVEAKEDRYYSSYNQVYLPSAVSFGGSYMIHGWPTYPDGREVPNDFTGAGIRLSSQDAARLYELAEPDTTVLVHVQAPIRDTFVYAPLVPDVSAEHYLVADLENGTILAASDLHQSVPVASLTKLMTAVVAAEEINLDTRVYVSAPSFVQSLVPRLKERSSVSMYSLMQLLLVESSNEAAEVIAGTYGREDFITAMNAKARSIGMFDTTFDDPSGLSDENVSSLADMYKLARYIHAHRGFIFEISRTGKATGLTGGGEFADLNNFNEVDNLSNFVGGKIGETTAAGQTSVTLHDIQVQGNRRTVVVIVLRSSSRDADVRSLLQTIEQRYPS